MVLGHTKELVHRNIDLCVLDNSKGYYNEPAFSFVLRLCAPQIDNVLGGCTAAEWLILRSVVARLDRKLRQLVALLMKWPS